MANWQESCSGAVLQNSTFFSRRRDVIATQIDLPGGDSTVH
jgi:hypothetical protein